MDNFECLRAVREAERLTFAGAGRTSASSAGRKKFG
jgi:hypothetical protein